MTDFFALLKEPRRPWLEPASLKAKFLAFSTEVHPDRTHQESQEVREKATQCYTEFNTAYNCLREPKNRLLHLLELESGVKPKAVQQVPDGTMDLFMEVAQLCRSVDNFLAESAKITSPLLKVQMFERSQEWTEKLNALQQKINYKREHFIEILKALNAAWDAAPPVGAASRAGTLPLDRLEQIYRSFSYVARWTGQVQERIVQLSL